MTLLNNNAPVGWQFDSTQAKFNAESAKQYSQLSVKREIQGHSIALPDRVRTDESTSSIATRVFQSAESVLDRALETKLLNATVGVDGYKGELTWKTGEAVLDRNQKITMANDQTSFQAAEKLLDRANEIDLQDDDLVWKLGTAVLDRALEKKLLNATVGADGYKGSLVWETAEKVLDRAQDIKLLTATVALNGYKGDLTWKTGEAVLDRTLETDLLTKTGAYTGDLVWKSAEAVLDRINENDLQDDDLDWNTAEKVLDRALDIKLLTATTGGDGYKGDLTWKTGEAVLDRAFEGKLLNATTGADGYQGDLTWKTGEAVLDRAQKVTMVNDQTVFQSAQKVLDRTGENDLQDDDLDWKTAEYILDRAHKADLSSDQNTFNETLATRAEVLSNTLILRQLRLDWLGQVIKWDRRLYITSDIYSVTYARTGNTAVSLNPLDYPLLWNDGELDQINWANVNVTLMPTVDIGGIWRKQSPGTYVLEEAYYVGGNWSKWTADYYTLSRYDSFMIGSFQSNEFYVTIFNTNVCICCGHRARFTKTG